MSKTKPENDLALTHQEPAPMAVGIFGINVENLIAKAIDGKSAVETIKELRAMALDDHRLRAKQAFDAAMKAFQSECPVIIKSRTVRTDAGSEAYRFAPIEEIEIAIRPVCQRHGFSHKFPKMELGEGSVTVFCQVTHEAGHSETAQGTYRIGTRTKIMSDTQVDAATETFAKRRVLCSAYGLVLAGEDRDGGEPKARPSGPSTLAGAGAKPVDHLGAQLKRRLVDMTRSIHMCQGYNLDESGKAKLNQYLWDENIISDTETITELTPGRLADVVAKVEIKQRP